jgi:N-acylneuraminate cytidylyltransferase
VRLAVIPARGGSKRIPRKNIKPFCGKPMIAWPIGAATASELFDHVVVSTDDDEIAATAKQWGAEVPFVRPAELADDYVGTGPVVKHAAEWVAEHVERPELVCTLYATAPFVRPTDLRRGLEVLTASRAEIAFTVTSFPFPIQRAIRITADGRVAMFQPEHYATRSQDLEPAYHDAGQFYWSTFDAVVKQVPAFSSAAVPIVLPRHRVQDIDTAEDWVRAEMLMKTLRDSHE